MKILHHALLVSLFLTTIITANQTDAEHKKEIAKEYCYLADHLMQGGKTIKARDFYLKAVAIDEHNHDAHTHLGEIFFEQGEWANAVPHLEKTVTFDSANATAHTNLAVAYEKLNQFNDAIAMYKKAITLNPAAFQAHINLGNLYRHLERLEESIEPYKNASALQPNNLNVIMDLANAYNMLNYNEESLTLYKQIVEKNPNAISALYNFGYTLKKMGRLHEALDIYTKVLEKKSDYAPVHFSLSSIYLALGNLEKGFQEYEWRWKSYNESALRHDFPVWQGQDLNNKILYVFAEQGLGDTLQFVRYLPVIKKLYPAARIIFESQEPLITLIKQQPYCDLVISRNQRPATANYQIALMSIPLVLKTTLATIPTNTPYIKLSPDLINQWKQKLAHDRNFKIGICWQGNAGYSTQALRRAVALKSIHLKHFAPLFELPNVSIYSLQRMHGVDQINECSFKDKLICFDETFDTTAGRFMDTAAVMHQLDLIISVDTGTCHLAAAMNIPTWIILPFPSDWRWLLDRSDSPWYPSVKLFRQEQPSVWEPAIAAVVQELKKLLKPNTPDRSSTSYHDKPTKDQQMFFKKITGAL